jgi:hypothetical protein
LDQLTEALHHNIMFIQTASANPRSPPAIIPVRAATFFDRFVGLIGQAGRIRR